MGFQEENGIIKCILNEPVKLSQEDTKYNTLFVLDALEQAEHCFTIKQKKTIHPFSYNSERKEII